MSMAPRIIRGLYYPTAWPRPTACGMLQMKTLVKHYRVLRYDTRGHGQSDVPAAPYSFDDLVGDAVALLDHYQIERATFMGLSLGGMTGLGIALAHPGRLEALVCCDARADAPPQFVQGWNERINAVRGGGLASILPATVERWLSAAFRATHPDVVADVEHDSFDSNRGV